MGEMPALATDIVNMLNENGSTDNSFSYKPESERYVKKMKSRQISIIFKKTIQRKHKNCYFVRQNFKI